MFKIDGDNLLTNSIFDYESENEFTIRLKSTSSNGGYTFEKSFKISINNLPDLIEDIITYELSILSDSSFFLKSIKFSS